MHDRMRHTVQGDTSGGDEPPVDVKTKVLFCPVLARPKQNFCFDVNGRFVTTSAEMIPIPEESQFRFLDLFGHFAGIGTIIGAKMNQKGIVFLIHDSSLQR